MNDINAHDLARVERKVDDLATKVEALLDAWNTAQGMVKFVKYLSATVTTVSAAIAAALGAHPCCTAIARY